mgnify:CR=1 FL=1
MAFTHLHVHTEYSLLDGSNKIKEYVARVKELGMNSAAITDHGVMYGVIDFYRAAREAGIKPILGCEVYVAPNSRFDKELTGGEDRYHHLVLLAENNTGYANLMKIVSRGFTEGYYYKPRVDMEVLQEFHEGIIALSACLAGEVPRFILKGMKDEARKAARKYEACFGKGNYFLELQDHGIPEQRTVNMELLQMSRELDIPLVTTNDVHYTYAEDAIPHDILLVNRDGKLRELHKVLDRNCALSFITAADKPGRQTYERSAILLMLKAFYDTVGRENAERITVEFSLSNALFCRAKGQFTPDKALLERVEARMRELAAQALPIEKRSVNIDDAVAMFRACGLEDKARLLSYRINSHVNVYTLDGFTDYFYGYMVPDTGYLKWFALESFADGFILRLPDQADPEKLGDFKPPMKVFQAMHEAEDLSAVLQISDVGEMNDVISRGQATQMILSHEAMMEKQIGDIAHEIAARKGVRFVMIAGPSSSGKTTFSHRLSTQLIACGLRPHAIATDNYFRNRADTPRDERGEYDFECLGAMDVEGFNRDMNRLLNGETVEMPTYNFIKGVREYNGETLTLGENDVLVIEGIHCLNDEFSKALPKESKYRIYISCLTTLNVDDHNRIPTTDARLLRRIERDARTRGYGAQATIKMWPSVRRGEEQNIFPYQDSADMLFNSALLYETALLKPYVEPLLFGVPHDCPEYLEAKRLLKFLNYFLPLPADNVPKTSLLREFVGGGCYKT